MKQDDSLSKTDDPRSAQSPLKPESLQSRSHAALDAGNQQVTPPDAPTGDDKQLFGSPWRAPVPLGIGESLGQFYSVAAPVLAGFSITLVGLVVTSRSAFTAADLVLWLASVATGALVFAMQLGMWARQHWIEPAEYLGWFPTARRDARSVQVMRDEQANDIAHWDAYRKRAGWFYRLGLLAFLAAASAAMLPPDTPSIVPAVPGSEYLAPVTGLAWLALELSWVLRRPRFIVARLLVPDRVAVDRPVDGYPTDTFS